MSTKKASVIGPSFVLAPERYDPRRSVEATTDSLQLGEVVALVRQTVAPSDDLDPCLVLDTSDAREGIVIGRKQHTTDIGSTKKSIQLGDVIVSRLRPYLRQVAYVDHGILNLSGAKLLCSTEFYVLRSPDDRSIAFLIPYLLSDQVQEVLAASQEGGHHPRFNDRTLLSLPVPRKLLDSRNTASATVEEAVAMYRECEGTMDGLIAQANKCIELGRD
jgi:hypothetical protein